MSNMRVDEITGLVNEIITRRLKFADIMPGQYEMLSGEEHNLICEALLALGERRLSLTKETE